MRNTEIPHGNSLRRFFTGLAEHVFQTRLGVADPQLVDYLSDMLLRFTHSDELSRIRALDGRPIQEVADMMSEAQQRIGAARREVHRHIGDIALFCTGVYPETLKRMTPCDRKDFFIDYCTQGKRAYLIAATIETEPTDEPPGDVLERLSSQFEMCAFGLGEVRREWERHDDEHLPRPLLWE
jgi:hypothetical protein